MLTQLTHVVSFVCECVISICYTKLKLLLIAIESSNENGIGSHISINPGNFIKVEPGTRGFFIAGSSDEIKRAYFYCEACHKNVTNLSKIKRCKCLNGRALFGYHISNLMLPSSDQLDEMDKEEASYDEAAHKEPNFDSINCSQCVCSLLTFHSYE